MFSTRQTVTCKGLSGANLTGDEGLAVKVSTATVVLAGIDEAQGVLIDGGIASGDEVTVCASGPCHAISGAAFALHDILCSDAAGKFQVYDGATYTVKCAKALEPASAADQKVLIDYGKTI